MKHLIKLVKVLLKNDNTLLIGWTKEKNRFRVLIAAIVCILLESILVKFMFAAYLLLAKSNSTNILVAAAFSVSTLLIILFSFFYVIDVFYFSKDIEVLMTFPLKAYQILGAKIAIVLMHQYLLEAFLILPTLIVFNYRLYSIVFLVYSIIVYFIFPIIPIAVCSILSMLIMMFRKFIKSRIIFNIFCGVFITAFIFIIYIANININKNDLYFIMNSTSHNYKMLMSNITAVFPNARFAAYSLLNHKSIDGFFYLSILMLASIGMVFIMLLTAKRVYFKSVIGINESKSIRKKVIKNKKIKQKPVFVAYVVKELRAILRTPAYFQNCILLGTIIPCIIFTILCKIVFKNYITLNSTFFIIGTSIIIFAAQLNEVCCTAISREGELFFIVNYIPVSFKTQILGKVMSGIIISFISEILFLISLIFIFKISIYMAVLILIVSTLGTIGFSFLGVLIDLKFPKFEWENEVSVVRNNFNASIHSIITLVMTVFIGLIMLMLQLSLEMTFAWLVLIYAILDVCFYKLVLSKGIRILEAGFYFNKLYTNRINKIVSKLKTVFGLLIIGASVLTIFISVGTKTSINITQTNFEIKAGFIKKNYSTKNITKVYLKNTVPEARKISGDNVFGVKRGKFYVEGMGNGTLFLQNDKGPFIYVILNKNFVIINSKNVSETRKLYNQLLKEKR